MTTTCAAQRPRHEPAALPNAHQTDGARARAPQHFLPAPEVDALDVLALAPASRQLRAADQPFAARLDTRRNGNSCSRLDAPSLFVQVALRRNAGEHGVTSPGERDVPATRAKPAPHRDGGKMIDNNFFWVYGRSTHGILLSIGAAMRRAVLET